MVVRVPRWLWWGALLCGILLVRRHRPVRQWCGGFKCYYCRRAALTEAELLGLGRRDADELGYVHQSRPSGQRGVVPGH